MSETTIQSAVVYAEQLYKSGRGIPLWYPEPSATGEVQIGDVGFLYNGGFHRLFNVTVPPTHTLNSKGVPENFEQLHPDVSTLMTDTRDFDLPQGVLRSSSIKTARTAGSLQGQVPGLPAGAGINLDFEMRSQQGAVLIIHDRATRKVVMASNLFRQYMNKHIKSWHAFSKLHHLENRAEDLLFVNGWTKTTSGSWHLAAIYETSKSRSGSISGRITTAVGAEITVSLSGSDSAISEERWWPTSSASASPSTLPTPAPASTDNPGDQCLFLVAFRAKRRTLWPGLKIVAGAGPHRLPDSDSEPDGMEEALDASGSRAVTPVGESDELRPGSFLFLGPCDHVLNYILKNTNAHTAIASEADIDDLFCGGEWPQDMERYLEDHQPQIDVEDGVGRLSLSAAVRQARMHETQAQEAEFFDDNHDAPRFTSSGVHIVEDGTLVIHTSQTKTMPWPHVVLHDLAQEMKTLTCMSVSREGLYLAAGSEEGHVGVWNYRAGKFENAMQEQEEPIWAIAMSYDGSKVASGGAHKLGIVWDIQDTSTLSVLDGHKEDIVAITWSRNDKFIATGSVDCHARIWDPSTGTCYHTLEGHEGAVLIVEFSPNSTRLVTFAEAKGRVWDTMSGALLFTLDGHEATVWSMAFSPDGDRIATCSEDGTSRIWSADDGSELVTFHEHGGPVYTIAFSPDGKEIATGSFDETVVVCDSYSAERRHNFDKHPSSVNIVVYSHSGRVIASGSTDGNVEVWDTVSGDFLVEFQGHDDKIKSIAFSPDDRDIVSASDDGSIRVWCLRDALRFL